MIMILSALFSGFLTVVPPQPFGPLPTQEQIAWQQMEYGMFCHFGINTFHNEEWTDGTKEPVTFLPTEFNARQWVEVAKATGIKYLVVTAKHHDGFAVYPTKFGEYNVKYSPWRNGKGDVIREVADACHDLNLMFGVYLSPWDRHDPLYNDPPAYDARFKSMLKELLDTYGPVGEVWFDGAGSKGHVYDWKGYYNLIREHAPQALIAICGPDIRWVGNEDGLAPDTLWNVHEISVPLPDNQNTDTKRWYPAECDVPIRKGQWFFHTDGEHNLRTLEELLEIYYRSIGLGTVLLLNVSPDRRGQLPDADSNRLMELHQVISETFHDNLAINTTIVASNTRGDSDEFSPVNLIDNNPDTYWATDDKVQESCVTITFKEETICDRFVIQEYIALGQRIAAHEIQVYQDGLWQTISTGTTIGYKRIHCFPTIKTSSIRVQITDTKAAPVIASLGVYKSSPKDTYLQKTN